MIRIVLADDHPLVREGIRNAIATHDDLDLVKEATNGLEALQAIQFFSPDVLLLDIDMPELSGLEVVKRLRQAGNKLPILILSAYDDYAYIKGFMELEVAGYMTKLESSVRIIEAIRGIASGEQGWYSPSILTKFLQKKAHQPDLEMPLTEREKEILIQAALGNANKKIAQTLFISEHTVKNHFTNIHQKLGTSSHAEAISWAWKQGLVKV